MAIRCSSDSELVERRGERDAARGHRVALGEQRRAVARQQRLDDPVRVVGVDGPEHRAHDGVADLTGTVGDGLVEQRQRIAHRAMRAAGDQRQRRRVGGDAFGLEDEPQPFDDQRRRQLLEVELQAAGENRDRDLLRIGRRQHELHVFGRLLERFQHRVERRLGQHVDFVDQVDLVAPRRRRVARVVEYFPHVVDAGVRRRVELQQVDEPAGVDVGARRADAAGRRGDAGGAVEALGQDARNRRLADTPGSGEEIRVVQAPALQRVGQRLDDVLLTGELGEDLGPPLAGQNLITHRPRAKVGRNSRVRRPGAGAPPSQSAPGAPRTGARRSMGWRAVPPALAVSRCGCFLPDLTRFTTLQCGATRR